MDFKYYLHKFQNAADQLDVKLIQQKQMEVSAGVVLNSVFLKLYKKAWTNSVNDPLNAEARIFFSIWINDSTIAEQKIFYNIHAFRLRKLNGYSIQSRKFAVNFRNRFKAFIHKWQNISIEFGPLTLMEGWVKSDGENIQDIILQLANNFLEIEFLVDDTLSEFKK